MYQPFSVSCFPAVLSPAHPLPPVCVCVSRSESVLELSIMPKDEDVLQLVSPRLALATYSIPALREIEYPCRFFDAVTAKECADHLRNGCRVTQPLSSVFSLRHAFIKSITAHVWKQFMLVCTPVHRARHYFFHPRRLLHAHSHDQTCITPHRPSRQKPVHTHQQLVLVVLWRAPIALTAAPDRLISGSLPSFNRVIPLP